MEAMKEIISFLQELMEVIKLIWDLKFVIIIGIAVLVLFLFYDRILAVVAHHKEVFKGGRKDD